MEEVLIGVCLVLCFVALGVLVAQMLVVGPSVIRSMGSMGSDGQFILPPDSSRGSTPPPVDSMFDRVATLFQASQGRPLASSQSLWEGNASETSRRLAAQGGITTSIEQAFLLQQAY
jgi:hypothetical protein